MNISERDKKLLMILAVLAIIFVPYFLVVQPCLEENLQIGSEIDQLVNRKSYLTNLMLQKEVYQEQTEEMQVQAENLLNQFPSGLPQEASILFMDNTEKMIPIRLHQVTFGEDVLMELSGEQQQAEAAQEAARTEEIGGDGTADVLAEANQDTAAEEIRETIDIGSNMNGLSTETQFAFEAGYKEFKDFLFYIKNYKDRMVITGMSASYLGDTDTVSGSFTLKQYAIEGEGRLPVSILEPALMKGTTNIFLQAVGLGTGTVENEGADFFFMLSQPEADVEAKIIGKSNDASQVSYLFADQNSEQEMTIEFEGENGQYLANYAIGNESNGEGEVFVKAGTIVLEIISSPRVGENDQVAAKIQISNKTDLAVKVKVLNDDNENPRVTIMGKTGIIEVEQ